VQRRRRPPGGAPTTSIGYIAVPGLSAGRAGGKNFKRSLSATEQHELMPAACTGMPHAVLQRWADLRAQFSLFYITLAAPSQGHYHFNNRRQGGGHHRRGDWGKISLEAGAWRQLEVQKMLFSGITGQATVPGRRATGVPGRTTSSPWACGALLGGRGPLLWRHRCRRAGPMAPREPRDPAAQPDRIPPDRRVEIQARQR